MQKQTIRNDMKWTFFVTTCLGFFEGLYIRKLYVCLSPNRALE